MAEETRGLELLPLSEQERKAMRESQESKALAIENKRRESKGEPLLDSLADERNRVSIDTPSDESSPSESSVEGTALDASPPATEETSDEDEEQTDVLLLEAGRILADVMGLSTPLSTPQTASR